jgi:hypothetical protein
MRYRHVLGRGASGLVAHSRTGVPPRSSARMPSIWSVGVQVPRAARVERVIARASRAADDSGYPGEMLAFNRKKFVGSYLALRAVSRVHWLSL